MARFEDGSTELTKLKDQSVGTATIELTYDANNKLTLTFHRNSFAVAEVGDSIAPTPDRADSLVA